MALTNLICNFAKILITNYIYYEILKNYHLATLVPYPHHGFKLGHAVQAN
jgi:hypothetical protein